MKGKLLKKWELFFLIRTKQKKIFQDITDPYKRGPGSDIERRRSHRMHVALPMEVKVFDASQQPIVTTSIATNISESGIYAEYLDLDAADKIDAIDALVGKKAQIHIFPSAHFPSEFDVMGIIRRKKSRGKQLGIGIEFVA